MTDTTLASGGVETAGGEAPLLSMRAAVILVVVAVFAFSALIVLMAWAPELQNGDDGQAHALSRSAVGYAGLVEALGSSGSRVLVSRSRLPSGRNQGVLVATPQMQVDEKAVQDLGFAGPVLIVLPKWMVSNDSLHHGWVTKLGPMDPRFALSEKLAAKLDLQRRKGTFAPVLRIVSASEGTIEPLVIGRVDQLQVIRGAGLAPVLTDQDGEVVLARDPKTSVYFLSDPDLINNQGLKDLRTFTAALSLMDNLRRANGPVIFDVTLDGLARDRSLLRLFFAPPLMGVTLCLAAAAALAGFQAFCRFGPVRRETRAIAAGKEAMVDNAAQLIRMADRQGAMAARYGRLTADLVTRQIGAPRSLNAEAQTAMP